MSGYRGALLAVFLLAACDGNPFAPPAPEPVGDTTVSPLPGTTSPRAATSIARYEDENGDGDGFVKDTDITYDAENDEFHVNNLAFDILNGVHNRIPLDTRPKFTEFCHEQVRRLEEKWKE